MNKRIKTGFPGKCMASKCNLGKKKQKKRLERFGSELLRDEKHQTPV